MGPRDATQWEIPFESLGERKLDLQCVNGLMQLAAALADRFSETTVSPNNVVARWRNTACSQGDRLL